MYFFGAVTLACSRRALSKASYRVNGLVSRSGKEPISKLIETSLSLEVRVSESISYLKVSTLVIFVLV